MFDLLRQLPTFLWMIHHCGIKEDLRPFSALLGSVCLCTVGKEEMVMTLTLTMT
jgi:hypothetical protein